MSKFCHKCGSKLNDMDVFCEICGVKQATSTIRPAVEESDIAQPAEKAKKMPKGLIIGIGAGVAAIVLIVILAIVFFGTPYKSAVEDYFDFNLNGAFEKLEGLAPEEYWEYLEDMNGTSVEDAIEYYEEYEVYDAMIESLEPEYGKNIKFSYKIVHEDELSERKLDTIKDGLKDKYGIAKRTVKKAYELEVDVTIKGSEDTDTEELEIIVVNIGNDWYVVSSSGTFSFSLLY